MKLSEVMHKGAEWVSPDMSLADIARRMRDDDIGAVPVGEDDRLVGMITDRDITIRAVAEDKDPGKTTARDVMTGDAIWCYEDVDINEAANLMKQKRVRRIPVVDRDKRLVGMVSVGDLTSASEELAGDTLKELSAVGD